MDNNSDIINFTIITGFLGVGKTTLLRHLLTDQHDQKLAVIINEFGEIGIDGALVLDEAGDRMLEMNNGCVCCEVRDDLVAAITSLLNKRNEGLIEFDQIVMETTGIARPGPIVETLHSPTLKRLVSLNGIITVVDAFHVSSQLDEFAEAQEQIGVADFIILNKTDLVDNDQLLQIKQRIESMNTQATIQLAAECNIDVSTLFNIADDSMTRLDDGFENKSNNKPIHEHHHKPHLDNVSSLSIEIVEPLQKELLLDWFSFFIMRYEERLLRFKGILNFKDHDNRTLFQGIHSLFEAKIDREWLTDELRVSRIVFIGKDLPKEEIRSGIKACIANSSR
ncbi:MAG TPA: GTP-binding protein [Cycloclasticus sp.]|jgi:G3E family GTPase|nr:GTP-binding protein [Cycloclasticus sp.]